MLPVTQELIHYLQQSSQARQYTVLQAMVHTIVQCGSAADADALLPVFLQQPADLDHVALLPVLRRFGDKQTAEKVAEACTENNRLKEIVDEGVLQLLGALQHEPSRPLLMYYAFEKQPYDYYQNKYAVLGLLHMNCEGLQETIKASIENCYGQNLFPEFVPALVCKLNAEDKKEVLEKLFELGATTASTDCNAGIILGFSLCGSDGESYFSKALFDPAWELHSTSTGSLYFTYQSLQNLSISFQQLFEKVKAIEESDNRDYALNVLLALLEVKINEPLELKTEAESIAVIYTLLFDSEVKNLAALTQKQTLIENIDRIEKLLELKMREEMLLKNVNKQSI